jgi:hypothetical protein
MYVLIITSDNLIYMLYNKKEQDLYNTPDYRDYLALDTVHDDYKFYYNIYSLGEKELSGYSITRAEFIHNRLVILYTNEGLHLDTRLVIYDLKLNKTVHETKLFHL